VSSELVARVRLGATLAAILALLATTLLLARPVDAASGRNNDAAKLCQKLGWMSLYQENGARFASQDACVSYAAHGGTILATPPLSPWQEACVSWGGANSGPDSSIADVRVYSCTGLTEAVASVIFYTREALDVCAASGEMRWVSFFTDHTTSTLDCALSP
jgi:hypothetical protein